jgi:hypothetical protein
VYATEITSNLIEKKILGSTSVTSGVKTALIWMYILSSIVSSIGILFGTHWTVKALAKETNEIVAQLIFLPLFCFRMLSYLIIIAVLHSFSFLVFPVFALLTVTVFITAQAQIFVEPMQQTFLSFFFPVTHLPSTYFDTSVSLKLYFLASVAGNSFLFGILGSLFALYSSDVYNPWCLQSKTRLIISEVLMNNIHFPVTALFASATIPTIVVFMLKCLRLTFSFIFYSSLHLRPTVINFTILNNVIF